MMGFRDKLEAVIDRLARHKHVDLEARAIAKPASEAMLARVEAKYRVRLPAALRAFYRECNGVHLVWRLATDELGEPALSIDGSIRILPVLQMFGGWQGWGWKEDLYFDHTPEVDLPLYRSLRPFDYFDRDDSGFVGFVQDGDRLADRMVVSGVDWGVHRLPFDFEGYLALVLKTAGFFRWPFITFNTSDAYHRRDALEAEMKRFLPELVEGARWTEIRKRAPRKATKLGPAHQLRRRRA